VSDWFSRVSASTPQVNHAGRTIKPKLAGSCKSRAASI
jgi:hypothetical protein